MELKRIFDIVLSGIGLLIAGPAMLAIAGLVKFESKGPVFYACERVGRNRKPFGMLKFRTMLHNADRLQCKLCPSGDKRVTPLGRFLRLTKLNELPQLFNVLAGQMSLVGPRPEDPKFMSYYKHKWDVVLSVRPGIAGPNQIANRNEEDLFPGGADPEEFYVDYILPEKLDRDVAYVRRHTLWGDIALLYKAIYVSIFEGFSLKSLIPRRQTVILLLADTGLSICAYLLANLMKYETLPIDHYIKVNFLLILLINPVLFLLSGLYRRTGKFFSIPDVFLVIKLGLVAGIILVVMNQFLFPGSGHSRMVFVLYSLFLPGLLLSKRFAEQIMLRRKELGRQVGTDVRRVAIYGAGQLGTATLKILEAKPGVRVVGFIDDDPNKQQLVLSGRPVLGRGLDLQALSPLHDITSVVIAFNPCDHLALSSLCNRLTEAKVKEIAFSQIIFEQPSEALAVRNNGRGWQLFPASQSSGFSENSTRIKIA